MNGIYIQKHSDYKRLGILDSTREVHFMSKRTMLNPNQWKHSELTSKDGKYVVFVLF